MTMFSKTTLMSTFVLAVGFLGLIGAHAPSAKKQMITTTTENQAIGCQLFMKIALVEQHQNCDSIPSGHGVCVMTGAVHRTFVLHKGDVAPVPLFVQVALWKACAMWIAGVDEKAADLYAEHMRQNAIKYRD